MNDRDFLKEAEQNVLNRARDMDLSINLINAFIHRYSSMMPERYARKFGEKMSEAREIIFSAYGETIMDLFMFTGVGGDEATEYAREKMKERFNTEDDGIKYSIMQLLERNGKVSWYNINDEKEFRNQVKEKVKEKLR